MLKRDGLELTTAQFPLKWVNGPLCDLKAEAMMTTIGSLFQSPEAPQSATVVGNQLRNIEEKGAELLELRTEAGVVYLCPSRLQRIRLRWAFRHFHVLPPQVLSRRDQRLIEKLSRSAVVTPTLPVASNTVFGVVERMRSKSPASAAAMVAKRTELAATGVFRAEPEAVGVTLKESTEAAGGQETRDVRIWHWAALGAVTAVCITVSLALIYQAPRFSRVEQMKNPRTLSRPAKDAAYDHKPRSLHRTAAGTLRVSSETATVPSGEKPKSWVAHPQGAPVAGESGQAISAAIPALTTVPDASHDPSAGPASIVATAATKPLFVSELPQSHVVYPSVSGRNLVGELQLKALIGADGSVKEVTVLSGNPKLAEAGVRAVRRWHYTPHQMLGTPVEVETRIKISFFGPDAVSIASAGNEPSSKLK
jgi:Gram-negative bacterial TonB protein C-terminal